MPFTRKAAQPRVSEVKSMIAPLGGINDTDPLANMGEQYCIQMVNWVPGNAAILARQGYREWCTGLSGAVKTIMAYYKMDGTTNLFASTDAGIYDITISKANPTLVKVVVNGDMRWVTFGNVANQYLVAVSAGSDPSVFYDGAAWNNFVETSGTPATPGEIKGVNPNSWCHVTTFKRRLWFVEENSMTAWYLPVDAVAGVAKPFYLTSIFKRGGKLLYMIDWSVDGGDGLDDRLVFVSSLGEVAVYGGDNPDVTTDWMLEAVFYAGTPVGDKSFTEFGGDVLMMTMYGLIPLTKVLMGRLEENPTEQAINRRISRTINLILRSKKYNTNWEIHNVPLLQAIVIIIPPFGQEPAIQFVMNSLTGAWTRFDMPIFCGRQSRGDFYFGAADGTVYLYGANNYLDNVKLDGTGGLPVQCSLFSAYNYMDDPTCLKHWKLIRPIFQSDQPPSYLVRLNTDYDLAALPGAPAPPAEDQENPIWDIAIWDNAFWSSSITVFRPWTGVVGLGYCCALLMKAATNDATAFVAVELVYEKGGVV